ncbi:MAG TPA: YbaB/EbfC family nucleoid-associated protein [Gemmatimonadales bacterium]|nr:YbaB/EbfC family nucleoid-associated protein [Gemmatimonadales bacterium]
MVDPIIVQLNKGMRSDLIRLEAELDRATAEATAGGGMVRARVNGHGVLRALEIDPAAFEGRDAALLADLVMSAITEAQRRAEVMVRDTGAAGLDAPAG